MCTGGSIDRWEDKAFRQCFDDILSGNWKQHDPYDLANRVDARVAMYGKANQVRSLACSVRIVYRWMLTCAQASVFRAYQGWLALSNTAPGQGTLQVFPDVLLSNAYIILRPFFKPTPEAQTDIYNPAHWKYGVFFVCFPQTVPEHSHW